MFAYTDKVSFPARCTFPTTWTSCQLTFYFHKFIYFFSIFIHLLKEHYLDGPNDILNLIILAIYEKNSNTTKGNICFMSQEMMVTVHYIYFLLFNFMIH